MRRRRSIRKYDRDPRSQRHRISPKRGTAILVFPAVLECPTLSSAYQMRNMDDKVDSWVHNSRFESSATNLSHAA